MSKNDLFESLRRTPVLLADFLAEIGTDTLSLRLKPEGWTIRGHAVHLMDVQPMLRGRLNQFIEEEHPVLKPYLPDDAELAKKTGESNLADELERFTRERSEFADRLEEMSDKILRKEAHHPEYNRYTPLIMVRHMLLHDHLHMYRMEEIWLTRKYLCTKSMYVVK